MQLLAEHKTLDTKDLKMNTLIRDASSHKLDVKEMSDTSLLMNPVASGDNVVTALSSAHKMKEELPPLVPCCEGRELKISEELVRSGLSAISVKHDGVVQCLSMSCACDKSPVLTGLVKHRNSFRSLHRPDLKRVPYLRRMTPNELESLFRGYADVPTLSPTKDTQEHVTKITPSNKTGARDVKDKILPSRNDDTISVLKPIPETNSGVEDVPAGMRLHGARARLYTSVPGGTKTGHHMRYDEYYSTAADDVPDDEVQLNEELQIILPPRCDDVANASCMTNSDGIIC